MKSRGRAQGKRFEALSSDDLDVVSGGWSNWSATMVCTVGAYAGTRNEMSSGPVQEGIAKAGGGMQYIQNCKDDLLKSDDHHDSSSDASRSSSQGDSDEE